MNTRGRRERTLTHCLASSIIWKRRDLSSTTRSWIHQSRATTRWPRRGEGATSVPSSMH